MRESAGSYFPPASFLKALTLGSILFFSVSGSCGERELEKQVCPLHRHEFDQIQKRAEASNPEAQTVLASCYELGRNVKPSRAETIHWLKLAADQGYAPAEYELGRIYLYGRGIPADYQQALLWEKKAALQGNRNAQRDLAFMYEREPQGRGARRAAGAIALGGSAREWQRRADESHRSKGLVFESGPAISVAGAAQDRTTLCAGSDAGLPDTIVLV